MTDLVAKAARFDRALLAFVSRVAEDPTVLAVVRLGSGQAPTLWDTDSLHLWIVIADKSQPRRRSDGDGPRIFRTFVEDDVDLHAELIERAKFKRMLEGNDRNTASFDWFAVHTLLHCADESISGWFAAANTPAARDRQHDRLVIACWIHHALTRVRRRLTIERRLDAALGDALELAHALAFLAVIDAGEIVEHHLLERALQLEPALLKVAYTELLAQRSEAAMLAACAAAEAHLASRWDELLEPIVAYLRRVGTPVPLSELAEHFATSALAPWHLSSACEWMVEAGRLTKLSAPAPVTKKSRLQVEEPAYGLIPPRGA